jgi:hypothetical protein
MLKLVGVVCGVVVKMSWVCVYLYAKRIETGGEMILTKHKTEVYFQQIILLNIDRLLAVTDIPTVGWN